MSLHGVLTITSVDPVGGDEAPSGELVAPGARNGVPFRSTRGESFSARHAELAALVVADLRALDADARWPVTARFEIAGHQATLVHHEPASLSPTALVRVLVTRVQDERLTRADAIDRLTADVLAANGSLVLTHAPPTAIAHGLAASAGVATGRLARPDDFHAPSTDPRIVIVDDAAPEDAMAIRLAAAIIATSGGLTADAAIAARALRKPCVVSTPLRPGRDGHPSFGDWVTVDGTRGDVYISALPTRWEPSSRHAAQIVEWLAPLDGETLADALARARKLTPQGAIR